MCLLRIGIVSPFPFNDWISSIINYLRIFKSSSIIYTVYSIYISVNLSLNLRFSSVQSLMSYVSRANGLLQEMLSHTEYLALFCLVWWAHHSLAALETNSRKLIKDVESVLLRSIWAKTIPHISQLKCNTAPTSFCAGNIG